MDVLDHEKLNLTVYSQVVCALNKTIDGLEVISEDIEGGYLSLRSNPSSAIKAAGDKVRSQIHELVDNLEVYRKLFIGDGVDCGQFQRLVLNEAKKEEKKAEEAMPAETPKESGSREPDARQVGGSRVFLP